MVQQLSQNMPAVTQTVKGFAVTIKSFADKIRENWPAIKDVIGTVADSFQRLARWMKKAWEWFDKLPVPVQTFLGVLALATKLGIVGAFAGAIKGLATAFVTLNLALLANPITWIVIAITIAVIAIIGLICSSATTPRV